LKVQYNKSTGKAPQYEPDQTMIGYFIPVVYDVSPELKALWDKGEDGAVYEEGKDFIWEEEGIQVSQGDMVLHREPMSYTAIPVPSPLPVEGDSVQEFEKYPELAKIIEWIANNVSISGSRWNKLLWEINKALASHNIVSDSVQKAADELQQDIENIIYENVEGDSKGLLDSSIVTAAKKIIKVLAGAGISGNKGPEDAQGLHRTLWDNGVHAGIMQEVINVLQSKYIIIKR